MRDGPSLPDTTMTIPIDHRAPRRGRGAVGNPAGRFESHQVEPFDDGWGSLDQPLPEVETKVLLDASRSAITTNDSPDVPFDRSINPYRGCEHGCSYCFARPSHAYLGFSPGLDFESRIVAKPDAPDLLRAELRRPGYRCERIALGSNTDPYQPVEREWRITRGLLEVLWEARHPVGIVTKSAMVLRDLDLLVPMAREGLARVMISITTLDPDLARRMEPRAAAPHRRLETIRALAAAGVPVGVLASPMIPALNDFELERILERSAEAGAESAGYVLVRLPWGLSDLFEDWLREHYPGRAGRVLNAIRAARGGALNSPRFGERMRGTGEAADLLARRFEVAIRRYGLIRGGGALDTTQFRRPAAYPDQLTLF